VLPAGQGVSTALKGVYPNPANTSTNFEFALERNAIVQIGIYSMAGELVSSILDQNVPAGNHTMHGDVSSLPAGNYMVRFVCGDVQQVKPLSIVR
jgi:hypothetical protein